MYALARLRASDVRRVASVRVRETKSRPLVRPRLPVPRRRRHGLALLRKARPDAVRALRRKAVARAAELNGLHDDLRKIY
jgi:hypothetical protein